MKRPTFQSHRHPSLPSRPPPHPIKRETFLNVQSASSKNEIERVGGKAVILIELRGLI